jgi:tellurite resistance protein TerC
VEKSLSVDNLFVFVVIMSTFAVPAEHQHRVLTFGIVAALVLRAIFIALGAALLAAFSFMFVVSPRSRSCSSSSGSSSL